MTVYRSNVQQTVFDVALMHYGSVEGLAKLITDNPGLVLTDGTIAQFRIDHRIDKDYTADSRYKTAMLDLVPATEGIGLADGPWTSENGQEWVTEGGQSWWTNM